MIVLASASPRRKELLERAGFEFISVPAQTEEIVPEKIAVEDMPEYLAVKKAEAVLQDYPNDIILSADTMVELDGVIYGKPGDERSAFHMLRQLSGKTHHVYTGVCILANGEKESFTTCTKVEFYWLTDEEIWDYIHTGEPMDKAGAYGIQGRGAVLVKRIQGDFYTVMGLPIGEVFRRLRKLIKPSNEK